MAIYQRKEKLFHIYSNMVTKA